MKFTGISAKKAAPLGLSLVFLAQACGGSDNKVSTTTGQAATGGALTAAGAPSAGGAVGLGGVGNSGGVTSSNPNDNQGGANSIDAKKNTGGQSQGGSPSIGGTTSTGGSTATGGTVNSGPVAAIDILYMIDNSSSMADKQQVLAASLPQILAQLAQPNCVDSSGQIVGLSQLTQTGPTCATGKLELRAINDIHIGIVSSSLGDHGGGALCTPGAPTQYTDQNGAPIMQAADENDMGRLLGTSTRGTQALQKDTAIVQDAIVKLDPKGFLAWGAPNPATLPTSTDLNSATAAFKDMVVATAQAGCGFESQLESWFRFLIDPVPPQYPIAAPDSQSQTHRTGVDDVLLAQRAAFLRPNSLLLVVMLTDENDCSIRDTDVGWVATDTGVSIPAGSPTCATSPNDPCCFSCSSSPPANCQACLSTTATAADDGPYQANVRCYNQKRRFGYSFLYPTSRYYVGLTHKELCPDQTFGDMDCDCVYAKSLGASCSPGSRRLPNPLFSQVVGTDSQGNPVSSSYSGNARSDGSRIFLSGIIGVPWQDISESSSQGAGANLTYIPVTDPRWTATGIWSQISGDDDNNIVAGDVHMVESLTPRSGLQGPTTSSPTADPKNGHEYNTAREDLEYACTFTLEGAAPARPCACTTGSTNFASCKYQNPNDCCDLIYNADGAGGPGGNFDKPLCQNPTTGVYGNTQYFAKAYPGLREIAVLHDYAVGPANYTDKGGTGNSIVTSICPKVLTAGQESSPGYGYNPVARAIIERLKERLQN